VVIGFIHVNKTNDEFIIIPALVIAAFITLLSFIAIPIAAGQLIKINTAPRLYLVEWARGQISSLGK
jgi:hypothetical protein